MKKYCLGIFIFIYLGSVICDAQYATLYNFNGPTGANPNGSLTLFGGMFYGMTESGAGGGLGCVFSINPDGSGYSDLFDFTGLNGANPYGSLTLSGNRLYGMTEAGGANNYGCIFSIDTDGSGYSKLLDFNDTNGANPWGALALSQNRLFGMTNAGGIKDDGCIFSINTDGTGYRKLLDFNVANGSSPFGSLTLSGNTLYGMTSGGGAAFGGCIFSVDTDGTGYVHLYDFIDTISGINPNGSLTLSRNVLYGMTSAEGPEGWGTLFSINTNGSSYKNLVQFGAVPVGNAGWAPYGSLTLIGNELYGMTDGFLFNQGNIFSVDTDGTGYQDLFIFNDSSIAESPIGDLTFLGNALYGMTPLGGTSDSGVIFSFNVNATGTNKLTLIPSTLNLYPNPNNGQFTLDWSLPNSLSSFEVYNVFGELVYYTILNQSKEQIIDLDAEPTGVYTYKAVAKSGELIGDGKLIIKK